MMVSSEQELADTVASATGPLRIFGGGTRGVGIPGDGNVLSISGLSGITLHEPGALTLVVKAGTPVTDIDNLLRAKGQRLPFEPMDHRGLLGTDGVPTIGGVVAGNVSGPRRVQVGACRDLQLGVRFVDGMGNIVSNGGRVMKNVTGYDLVKLMAGSFGSLGVISEVSFKVLPIAETCAVLLIKGLSDRQAVRAMTAALGSPFDVSGAAHDPGRQDDAPLTMIRLEGFAGAVGYRVEKLRKTLVEFGDVLIETDKTQTAALWRAVRNVTPFHGTKGDVWRVSVKPSDGPLVGAVLAKTLQADLLYDWGGGLVWALVPEGSDVRAHIGHISGHATLVRAADAVKSRLGVFQSSGPVLDRIAAELRGKFDPRQILNPGVMSISKGA